MIPLCHNILIDSIEIDFIILGTGLKVIATAQSQGKTGIEMEALTAASVAALTIYDMCKGIV